MSRWADADSSPGSLKAERRLSDIDERIVDLVMERYRVGRAGALTDAAVERFGSRLARLADERMAASQLVARHRERG